jgi:Holliday junction DNA helicase RuvA
LITKISGKLVSVHEDSATIAVDPFEYQVLIPDFTLRAMVRPVPDVAKAIEQQDVKNISTLPGIGPATSERIVAKLRRKMPKFALMAATESESAVAEVELNIVEETHQILVTLGHSEAEARRMLETPLSAKKKFKDVDALLAAVYEQVSAS